MAAKVKTHIGQIREQFTCNRQSILTALSWDEDTYNNTWIDMGKEYLESQYPAKDTRYAKHNQKISKDRKYWQWWLLEWKNREAKFCKMFQGYQFTANDYLDVMSRLLKCFGVDKSFEQNYLRL